MKGLFEPRRPFYKKKIILIPLVLILAVLVLRLVAEPVILGKINSKLKDISPSITAQVGDLDLKILKGQGVLRDIVGNIKLDGKQFLSVDSVTGHVDLKELFKGNIVTWAVVDKVNLSYSDSLMTAIKEHLAKTKDEKKPLPKIRVSRVDLKDSTIRLEGLPSEYGEDGPVLNQINARATNIIPSKDLPKTIFSMQGKLLGSGDIKVTGEALIEEKPMKWDVDQEILGFDLTALNPILKQKVPMTFSHGVMDLYAEAKSENDKISGYLKPFIKNLEVIHDKEKFEGSKQWFFEIITALGNTVVDADKVAATRVPFIFDEGLKTQTGDSLSKAFQHGYVQELERGIENSIQLGSQK